MGEMPILSSLNGYLHGDSAMAWANIAMALLTLTYVRRKYSAKICPVFSFYWGGFGAKDINPIEHFWDELQMCFRLSIPAILQDELRLALRRIRNNSSSLSNKCKFNAKTNE